MKLRVMSDEPERLIAARHVLLVARGEAKRSALERALEGDPDPMTPASYLNRSADVTVLTDLPMR